VIESNIARHAVSGFSGRDLITNQVVEDRSETYVIICAVRSNILLSCVLHLVL
jgi:hypothetical protein